MRILYAPEVADDLSSARDWYESCSEGLGMEFTLVAFAQFAELRDFPERNEMVHGLFRRALFRRFPYAVYYQLFGADITIYGVFHTSRDPAGIRDSLSGR